MTEYKDWLEQNKDPIEYVVNCSDVLDSLDDKGRKFIDTAGYTGGATSEGASFIDKLDAQDAEFKRKENDLFRHQELHDDKYDPRTPEGEGVVNEMLSDSHVRKVMLQVTKLRTENPGYLAHYQISCANCDLRMSDILPFRLCAAYQCDQCNHETKTIEGNLGTLDAFPMDTTLHLEILGIEQKEIPPTIPEEQLRSFFTELDVHNATRKAENESYD